MMKAKLRAASGNEVNKGKSSPGVSRRRKKQSNNSPRKDSHASDLIASCEKTASCNSSIASAKIDSIHSRNAKAANATVIDACTDTSLPDNIHDQHKKNNSYVQETIFSPAFHMSKEADGEGSKCDNAVSCKEETTYLSCNTSGAENFQSSTRVNGQRFIVDAECLPADKLDISQTSDSESNDSRHAFTAVKGGDISCNGTPLFLAMQQTQSLECNDESNSDSMVSDEDDESIDFDPYLFIKNLPDLSEVVSSFRPMLLPKQTRRCPPITLVLDLDETLVHSTLEPCDDADFTFPVHFNFKEHSVYVRCRPHLKFFMDRVANMFEIIVFTASQSVYAEQLLNVLDPKRKLIRHRVYRESCVFVDGNYLKDLTILGRDLAQVAIIDNSPQAFGFQVDNGIPIESWFDDRTDCALISLLPFLESLIGVGDVRPIISKKFNLRQKVEAATEYSSVGNRGDPLDQCY